MGNGNIDVGKETATRKPGQQQMAGAMSQQDIHVMGDNECAQQKLVRLVGCRDPQARLRASMRESDWKKRQF
ncbi:hypothetical protein [Bradyrhizobium neotropicale]|uniref:hypothetical protein n=1 Tax=Bradyrhizobium neotropicale TaxID=1497615 RepID=UPI001AEF980F|nr:hypothetical protein [Bradyrhizobium neotropicale]